MQLWYMRHIFNINLMRHKDVLIFLSVLPKINIQSLLNSSNLQTIWVSTSKIKMGCTWFVLQDNNSKCLKINTEIVHLTQNHTCFTTLKSYSTSYRRNCDVSWREDIERESSGWSRITQEWMHQLCKLSLWNVIAKY